MDSVLYLWLVFGFSITFFIILDLVLLSRVLEMDNIKTSSIVTMCWILIAALFAIGITYYQGGDKGLLFITGYVIELTLSIDNIFVFILLFKIFQIPPKYQHKVLLIGIISAIFMRLGMIKLGIYLVNQFQWIFYVFGIFLIYGGIKIIKEIIDEKKENHHSHENENKLLNLFSKYFNVSSNRNTNKFFVRESGKLMITPLFVTLILIEKSDLIFALDSIPAILAITNDTFIVFTSNIFAILGLRSMYFMLSHVMEKFIYLKHALAIILSYIGCKMILSAQGLHIPIVISLMIIMFLVLTSILCSIIFVKKSDTVK